MKKCISLLAALCLLVSLGSLPAAAFRLSYATDCLAAQNGMIKSGLVGRDIVFSDADFKKALAVTGFDTITITSLPEKTAGTLKLNGIKVGEGQKISRENVRLLSFSPAGAMVREGSFAFTCDKYCGGAAITCTVKFIDRPNAAPSVRNVPDSRLSVWTQKNITVFGSMSGSDPENDELTYLVVSYPKRGILTVTSPTYGDFTYTPKAGFKGRDSFSYVVRDCYGNYSGVATVNIRVEKQVVDISYADMRHHSAHNAALALTDARIMQGSLEGDGLYFHPEQSVSRAEFVVMAMKVAGISANPALQHTFFDDDPEIPESVKSYIATAQKYGLVTGEYSEGALRFRGEEPITRAEAAVIVARILAVEKPGTTPVFSDGDNIPVWAREAVYSLYEAGIFRRTGEGNIAATEPLSRGQAAEALFAMMRYRGK
ncbi:MAG: S-layer homology domain-containing protein [Eubacteriales bacterium]